MSTKISDIIQPATQPAEWESHEAVWMAWPSHEELWQEDLPKAQQEFTELCQAIGSGKDAERLEILVPHARARASAEGALRGLNVRFHTIPFGDIWLRDTAPIFVRTSDHKIKACSFGFNGWGGKYNLPHDTDVSLNVARASGLAFERSDWILEGGSLEVDGLGTGLTTEQCLLNPNRSRLPREAIEAKLKILGIQKTLWIKEGLLNDHTDGHIDTIARFVAPGKVVCMKASGGDDPNAQVLAQISRELRSFSDVKGNKLEVIEIPSPGKILDEDGEIMPASYVNFYIANNTVAVPTYGSPHDVEAVAAIAKIFPSRRTVGISAKAILTGGGAFHCITQQQPGITQQQPKSISGVPS